MVDGKQGETLLPIILGETHMNKKNIPFIIQLKQNNNYIVKGIEQNDAGVLFDIKIMDGLESFDFSGYSIVTLKIKKPDGTFTYDSSTGDNVDIYDPENGRIKLNIPTSCTAQNGMHFCTIGFGYDADTYFETTSFNYFVGEDPNADDDEVKGTNEFPILNNLILQISDIVSAEQTRVLAELTREDNAGKRDKTSAALIALFVETLGLLEDLIVDSRSMLQELNQAIAEGGSVDISTITVLAKKSDITNALSELDYSESGVLQVYRATSTDLKTLEEGELAYATDTNGLYVGSGSGNVLLNQPCFVATTIAPTDISKLWIDTSGTAPVIKYYNGSDWVSCNTVVFG